jgi:hypothetical protein
MSAVKHTPGPWVYERDNGPGRNRPHITTVAHCCDFVIGEPSTFAGGNYRDGDPSGDPEADARLLAAAPELLGALQVIVRGYGVTFQDAALRTLAVDAIAKATGSTS